MNQNPQAESFPLVFAVAFAVLWCVMEYVISIMGGWWQLAKRFRCSTPVTGLTWRFQSVGMRYRQEAGYRNCVNVTANEDGIGLSFYFLFRVAHPPLFIPWSDILVSQVKRFVFFKRVRLTFPEEPSVWIELTPKLAGKIQQATGQEWFPKTGE